MHLYKFNNPKSRSELFWCLLYRMILDISYKSIISKEWSYYINLSYHFSLQRLTISYILMTLAILCTPKIESTVSSFFLNLQLYIFLVPMYSLYALSDRSLFFLFGLTVCHAFQCFLSQLPFKLRYCKHISFKNNQILLRILLFLFALGIGVDIYTKIGFYGFNAFNLYKVYELRGNSISISTAMSYFLPWTTKVIIPFLIVNFLHRKKWFYFTACIAIQLYLYCIFAQKTYLFTPVLIIGVYILVKYDLLKWGFKIGLSILALCSSVIYLLDPTWIMPVNLFVRRVLYVPATLKFSFYEFFSNNPKVLFADGVIGKIFTINSPYEHKIPVTIAEYVGRPGANCNTGYWGDAYANMGWLGIILFSIIIIIYIKMIEHCGKNINNAVVIGSCSYLLYSLNDAALLTTLLTGGGIILLLIFFIYSMRNKYD